MSRDKEFGRDFWSRADQVIASLPPKNVRFAPSNALQLFDKTRNKASDGLADVSASVFTLMENNSLGAKKLSWQNERLPCKLQTARWHLEQQKNKQQKLDGAN